MNASRFARVVVPVLAALCTVLGGVARAEDAAPAAAAAPERDRIAVLIVAAGDARLSDNLTEVAIAALADVTAADFVGLRELRPAFAKLDAGGTAGLTACLEREECRRRAVGAAHARQAVIGDVRSSPEGRLLRLTLTQESGAERQTELRTSAEITELIGAVQLGARALLLAGARAEEPPPAPAVALDLVPPVAPDTSTGGARLPDPAPVKEPLGATAARRERSSPDKSTPYLSFALGGAGLLVLSAGAVTTLLASGAAQGNTRAQAQADLERRAKEKSAGAGLLVGGAVLSALSAVTLVFR